MKSAILTIALLVAIASFSLAYYQNFKAEQAVGDLNKERYSRMVAEEDLLKAIQKAKSLEKELESIRIRLKNSEKLLSQSQSVNKDLWVKLEKTENLKESLERKIQEMTKLLRSQSGSMATGGI